MYLSHWVSSIVAFLRAGYPTGMPTTGYSPAAAPPRRRTSNNEMNSSTGEFGVGITRVTDDMPSQDDIARVKRRLDAMGRSRR